MSARPVVQVNVPLTSNERCEVEWGLELRIANLEKRILDLRKSDALGSHRAMQMSESFLVDAKAALAKVRAA